MYIYIYIYIYIYKIYIGLALTLLKPVFEARREGSLAGLDARLWPLNFMNQMLWTG